MDRTTRARLVAAGTLSLAGLLALGACGGGGGSGSASPTSVVDSTAFRTIPVTAPPTTPAPVPAETSAATGGTEGSSGGSTGGSTGGATNGVYTVQSGDYFYLIAQKLGVDAAELAAYNDLTLQSNLTPGMTLRVPPGGSGGGGSSGGGQTSNTQPPATQAPSGDSGTYTVQPNDAWYVIASKLGVSVEALLAANGATLDTVIVPGQKLNVPG